MNDIDTLPYDSQMLAATQPVAADDDDVKMEAKAPERGPAYTGRAAVL